MSGPNRSTAVMQRRVEAHDSLDDFPTPPWATRALCAFLIAEGFDLSGLCREPAANRGHMVRPLGEYFAHVEASDIHDYGAGFAQGDYLFGAEPDPVDWTITNPPFRLAEQFIARACATSREGCAFLVRAAFLEGVGRYQRLFSVNPPAVVLQFSERVVMHKGRLAPEGSTATAYAWLIWLSGFEGAPRMAWVPPCRKELERDGDYPSEIVPAVKGDAGWLL
ncbi:hypothetical protein AQS8620_01316 [Aquimixticola soesokkakensis]|uniref:Methyltransferase n=1 Tax=Aquimixticola soesokkakensis TaxID=1519096 RepID=A0A1Y5SBC8_9RHOB|nr:methyltransferase [Aquimixticola soesokkakensis]SLN36749.1 hypothetical protein AQS8620_01316 [Aquimixticola soesokkakensis]